MSEPWTSNDADLHSSHVTADHHRRLWAWVAESYRLAGYGDKACTGAAGKAVVAYIAIKVEANGRPVVDKHLGPRTTSTAGTGSSSFSAARAALLSLAASASKKAPRGVSGGVGRPAAGPSHTHRSTPGSGP